MNYIPHGANKRYTYLPSRYNLPFEDVWLQTEDGVRIHSWLIKYRDSTMSIIDLFKDTPTIIFFHGNAGNISNRLANVRELYHHVKCNILLVEYRGYGLSEGSPTEQGLKLDALAAWKYLQSRRDINPNLFYLFGRSLGGAVVIDLAYQIQKKRQPLAGLIIENTYTSISDMIDIVLPYFKCFKWASRNVWSSIQTISHLSPRLPVLFLVRENDELIPPAMMHRLAAACRSRRRVIHRFDPTTEPSALSNYFETIRNFVSPTT